jgi:DNA-binding XRE family transcriptional regulator
MSHDASIPSNGKDTQRHAATRRAPFGSGAFPQRADRSLVATAGASELAGAPVRIFEGSAVQTAADVIGASRNGSSRLQGADAPLPGSQERLVDPHTSVVRETVGTNLRSARKRAGLSQKVLAKRSGVDKRTISRIERAQAETVLTKLHALAFALSVPLAELLAGLPEP